MTCGVTSLDQCARQSFDACVIASHVLHQFRRLLIERGALQHQEPNTAFSPANWVKILTINTIDALPFNWHHDPWPFELSSNRCSSGGCEGCSTHTNGIKLVPVTPLTLLSAQWNEVICTASCTLNKGSGIATVEAGHPIIRLSKCPSKFNTALPNAILQKTQCNCKNHHYTIVAKRDICVGEAISYTSFTDKAHILAQFDGSAKLGVGGAGFAVYVINSSGTRLIHWQAIVIPDCQDNVIAESIAAKEAVLFLNQFLRDSKNDILLSTIEGITIQGDILPVIKYLRYEGGLKRKDLVPILESARVCASRFLLLINGFMRLVKLMGLPTTLLVKHVNLRLKDWMKISLCNMLSVARLTYLLNLLSLMVHLWALLIMLSELGKLFSMMRLLIFLFRSSTLPCAPTLSSKKLFFDTVSTLGEWAFLTLFITALKPLT